MASPDAQNQLGKLLVDLSNEQAILNEKAILNAHVSECALPSALSTLAAAKDELEAEIRSISQGIAEEVDDWITHTKSIQEDVNTSQRLANSIVQQAEADEQFMEEIKVKELHISKLRKETSFYQSVLLHLKHIQHIHNGQLKIENLIRDKSLMDSLYMLKGMEIRYLIEYELVLNETEIFESRQYVFHNQSINVIGELELKLSNLREILHEELLRIWATLVYVDKENKSITIQRTLSSTTPLRFYSRQFFLASQTVSIDENISLEDVISGLEFFGDIPDVIRKFCNDLENLILEPRTVKKDVALQSIEVKDHTIFLAPIVNDSIKELFSEIKTLIRFLHQVFPTAAHEALSNSVMPYLSNRILNLWLEQTVPSSLKVLTEYKKSLDRVLGYITEIESIGWPGFDSIRDWVENFSKIWLNKRREIALEWTRDQILMRVEAPFEKEKAEVRLTEENYNINATPTSATERQDWDAAWGFEEDITVDTTKPVFNDVEDLNNKITSFNLSSNEISTGNIEDSDDDVVDAWGWGDEDTQEIKPGKDQGCLEMTGLEGNATSEIEDTLSFEEYWISGLPKSIRTAVIEIYEDFFDPHNPVFSVATGLFGIPSQILAMHRAISPSYYVHLTSGNMYRHNDSIWLSERLKEFIKEWNKGSNITLTSRNISDIDSEIARLESFGKRGLDYELILQKEKITTMLAGMQNFFRQDNQDKDHLEKMTSTVLLYIRKQASLWKSILKLSTWAEATGVLINTVATKIIKDIFDLPDIGIEEAERTSAIISKIETLDDLFIYRLDTSGQHEDSNTDVAVVPLTAQFADKWMKMKFLSEALQSNLKDVKFLWFESDLSLYFTAEEVIELIRLCFVMNTGVRQAIKEIRDNPTPR
ncbi:putative zw10 centromere kinetochore protein zw10 [Golovinomyces cichoracearum]|uniref:Putative zw10 centromere kinetochore protein zw10 n=1 Tax=Golovinomyces cichoracearum TaxID=62708 RepID=A0A420ICX6_9PEZI|nr:putative zw10 centromere kinetochore protein zw10 [Golovinomyces cichoracearum]